MPFIRVDAQPPLPRSPEAAENLIGNYASAEVDLRGKWKIGFFLRAVLGWQLVAANTINEPTQSKYTFPAHGRFKPDQIDFMLVHPKLMIGASCEPIDFIGVNISDHRVVRFAAPAGPGVWYDFQSGAIGGNHITGDGNKTSRTISTRVFRMTSFTARATLDAVPLLSLYLPDGQTL